jgi:hypothetical protein
VLSGAGGARSLSAELCRKRKALCLKPRQSEDYQVFSMNRNYRKSDIAFASVHNICLVTVICAIFFGFTCISTASDGGDTNLNGTYSSSGADEDANSLTNHAYSQSNSAALNQLNKEMLISGIGYGELLLTFTVNKVLPVFSGRYSYDIAEIRVPPITTPLQVESTEETGYSYDLSNVFIPGKPNNFTISASGVKTLSIGLKELPGSHETNAIWKAERPRTWISTQAKADEKGTAAIDSDLISPSIYQAKIFGDAAENVSQVNLTMTVVKKLVVNGPYNLSINTTGFPEGDYSFKIKALNGTFRMDEMSIEI